MSPLVLSLIALACVLCGTTVGMVLRAVLPDHHLSDDSKDSVKLGTGMVATLAALVLGLMIASAKGTFDTMTNELNQIGAKVLSLDAVLTQYGPETREVRGMLRQGVADIIRQVWPEDTDRVAVTVIGQSGKVMPAIQEKLHQLSPHNDTQLWLKSRALQLSADILDVRSLLLEQVRQGSVLRPLFVLLVFWLTIIFTTFGLFAPNNGTVIVVLLVCILSSVGSLFLIMEMEQPYRGFIKISSAPLRNALTYMGQ